MILVIDNYDSFVYNLTRYILLERQMIGQKCRVVRNNEITIDDIASMAPEAIVISPGPCTPAEAGISLDVVQKLGAHIPILGVCLGHQSIGQAYGGRTVRARLPMHGKATRIHHNRNGIFDGIHDDFEVGRYHSLIVQLQDRSPLEVTARSYDGEVMAIQHHTHPVYGVQFHPESILTEHGHLLIGNFLKIVQAFHRENNKESTA